MHIIDPRTFTISNFQKIKTSFADFPDFFEQGNQFFTSYNLPTCEDSNVDIKSGSSNCFHQQAEEHSIDLATLNENIIAVKTPIQYFQTMDKDLPPLELEN